MAPQYGFEERPEYGTNPAARQRSLGLEAAKQRVFVRGDFNEDVADRALNFAEGILKQIDVDDYVKQLAFEVVALAASDNFNRTSEYLGPVAIYNIIGDILKWFLGNE